MKNRFFRFLSPEKSVSSSDPTAEKANKSSAVVAGFVRFFLRLFLIALLFFIIFTKVFLISRASGNGMYPFVKDGDLFLAFRMQKEYTKDDMVVYSCGQGTDIGRIAAVEGDVVTLDESGIFRVNGTVQSGEIPYPTYAGKELTYPYKVPEGSVFLLGDNRQSTRDSRDFGAVPMSDVDGKIISILRRRGL